MGGWMGRILRVDLTRGEWREEALDARLAADYLGGRGLGARIISDEVPPGADPLGPQNVLAFCTGPLTGTAAPAAGRFSLSTRSPLTGLIHDSNAGGTWGVRLKRCGYDALIITGRASAPCWLFLDGERVETLDARPFWELDTWAATSGVAGAAQGLVRGAAVGEAAAAGGGTVAGEEPAGVSVLCIGPAGTSGALLAAIIVDGRRALARGGVGAVMGAKNLKAIAVAGARRVEVADPAAFQFVAYEAQKLVSANPVTSRALPQFGTAVLVNLMNELGILPARNFTASQFEAAGALSGEAMAATLLVRRAACWGCTIACGRVIRSLPGADDADGARDAGSAGAAGAAGAASARRDHEEGPEYESIWALGADCGIGSLEDVVRANRLCNRLGLDTISAGATIACAMEIGTRGGDGPAFGDAAAQRRLLRGMAGREGAGADMAGGARRYATRHGAADLAMHARGLELPGYDPRGMQGQGLAFATSNRGGCHLRANMLSCEVLGLPKMVDRFASGGRAGILIVLQHAHAAMDSLGVCKFAGLALTDEHWARLLTAATGIPYRTQDLQRAGERIWNLERLYNLRAGSGGADDALPARLVTEPVAAGPSAGHVVELLPMLAEYYRFRRWDGAGRPTPPKLAELGLAGLEGLADPAGSEGSEGSAGTEGSEGGDRHA